MNYEKEYQKIVEEIKEHKNNSRNIIYVKMNTRFYSRLSVALNRNVHYIEGIHVVIDNIVDDWQLY